MKQCPPKYARRKTKDGEWVSILFNEEDKGKKKKAVFAEFKAWKKGRHT